MPRKSINYNLEEQIDALRSIFKKKENYHFNSIISALGHNDFESFSKSSNNLYELQQLEERLSVIFLQMCEMIKEVEDIAAQVDKL